MNTDKMLSHLRSVLLMMMVLFTLVQWNDPDGPLWAAIYGSVVLLLATANWRPAWLRTPVGRLLVAVQGIGLLVAVIICWPTQAGFWHQEVWWEAETAREGMGLMIALLVSLTALPAAFANTSRQATAT